MLLKEFLTNNKTSIELFTWHGDRILWFEVLVNISSKTLKTLVQWKSTFV